MLKTLDLFCKAGGCSVGYHRAGFDVVGVDIEPQPRYPFPFVQMDALECLDRMARSGWFIECDADDRIWFGSDFAAIHASPPCQSYSDSLRHLAHGKPKLIGSVRKKLRACGIPYVIENVRGAPLLSPIILCGTSFGLPLRRHRLFECSFPIIGRTCCHTDGEMNPHRASSRKKIGYAPERQYAVAMGNSWMSKAEARQGIPPAYTEFIGRQLMVVNAARSA